MSTIAEFRLPAGETTMATTFDVASGVVIELESAVSKTLPSIWVTDVSREEIEAAFRADPTIDSFDLLVRSDDGLLYDVDSPAAQEIYDCLLASDGSLLEGVGVDGWWQFKMRFRDREDLVETHGRLDEAGLTVDLTRVTDVSRVSSGPTRLTPEQYEALDAAFERGYFNIPRQISMEELASELGISHQALSERLRRAYGTLVGAEVNPTDPSSGDSSGSKPRQ